MVRKKNVLSVLMQVFATVCVISLVWVVIGYSLAFTDGNQWVGDLGRVMLSGVTVDSRALDLQTVSAGSPWFSAIIPEIGLHDVPDDLRRDHPGADRGRLRRPDEVRADAGLHGPLVDPGLRADRPLGLVAQPASCSATACSTSPAARWCTSTPASPASSAASCSASGSASATSRWRRTTSTLTLIGTSLLWVGWFGFNAGSAGRGRRACGHGHGRDPHRAPHPPPSPGCWSSGSPRASRRSWASPRAPWPAWSRSPRPAATCCRAARW